MVMPFWNDGNVWAHSVTGRPALDVVSAALYLLGILALVVRYVRQRTWQDLFLLLSVPLLMMPSILSLAFPEENPALNRTAGAAVPIFIIAAIALEGFLSSLWIRARSGTGRAGVVLAGILLVASSASQNYDLVFRQYAESYAAASWNTSQIGSVVKDYIDSGGSVDTAWVVGCTLLGGYPPCGNQLGLPHQGLCHLAGSVWTDNSRNAFQAVHREGG